MLSSCTRATSSHPPVLRALMDSIQTALWTNVTPVQLTDTLVLLNRFTCIKHGPLRRIAMELGLEMVRTVAVSRTGVGKENFLVVDHFVCLFVCLFEGLYHVHIIFFLQESQL